jgi:hypothetical protein
VAAALLAVAGLVFAYIASWAVIESELQSVMEELMRIEGISEIDDAKAKLVKILDGLYFILRR